MKDFLSLAYFKQSHENNSSLIYRMYNSYKYRVVVFWKNFLDYLLSDVCGIVSK